MDYCAHENNLLHRLEIYDKSQKFVFSNRPQNFFISSLSRNLILSCKMKKIAHFSFAKSQKLILVKINMKINTRENLFL